MMVLLRLALPCGWGGWLAPPAASCLLCEAVVEPAWRAQHGAPPCAWPCPCPLPACCTACVACACWGGIAPRSPSPARRDLHLCCTPCPGCGNVTPHEQEHEQQALWNKQTTTLVSVNSLQSSVSHGHQMLAGGRK